MLARLERRLRKLGRDGRVGNGGRCEAPVRRRQLRHRRLDSGPLHRRRTSPRDRRDRQGPQARGKAVVPGARARGDAAPSALAGPVPQALARVRRGVPREPPDGRAPAREPLQVEAVERDRWSWMPALVHPLASGGRRRSGHQAAPPHQTGRADARPRIKGEVRSDSCGAAASDRGYVAKPSQITSRHAARRRRRWDLHRRRAARRRAPAHGQGPEHARGPVARGDRGDRRGPRAGRRRDAGVEGSPTG